METVFVTIHDLSLDARIRYCSESIEYILGYLPEDVKGKSCWEYFHPDEIPFAKAVHDRGIKLDKASVFSYCRIRHKDGTWIGCECVFTVVYDVLVASTAIYQRGPKSQKRALDSAGIRRVFASSPKDPRYHMLSFLAPKFSQDFQFYAREPRAALILNRFTRTNTIMFASNGVGKILGLQPHQLVGKSFYYCIAPNCLDSAIKCLESAKANDSIAYLRFWYRDPTKDNLYLRYHSAASSILSEDEDDDGGVTVFSGDRSPASIRMTDKSPFPRLSNRDMTSSAIEATAIDSGIETTIESPPNQPRQSADRPLAEGEFEHSPIATERTGIRSRSRIASDESNDSNQASMSSDREPVFDPPSLPNESSASSVTPQGTPQEDLSLELEAVVSCTSDGLVLVLRKAKPLSPYTMSADGTDQPAGLFASPWASDPVTPAGMDRAKSDHTVSQQAVNSSEEEPTFMQTIRDVAVFAWSLTSINGALVDHARGQPSGEALPAGGLPVYDPEYGTKENEVFNGFANSTHRRVEDIDSSKRDGSLESSDDEVLWKRIDKQPPWRRPRRRAHAEAFGADGDMPEPKDLDGRDTQSRRRRVDGSS